MIEASGVEAASVVAIEDGVQIIAVSAGAVRHRFEPVSGQETATEWRDIGSGFQPHISALVLSDGAIAVIAMALDGTLRGMMLERNSVRDQWTDLRGAFVGRIVALPKKNGVEIFGLTPEGDIQTATWQPGSQDGLLWRSLEGEPFVFIYAGEEDGSTHVIAVTRDRRVRVLSRENEHWPTCWVSLGTLDSVNWMNQGESNVIS
jgi:hypothetical protein